MLPKLGAAMAPLPWLDDHYHDESFNKLKIQENKWWNGNVDCWLIFVSTYKMVNIQKQYKPFDLWHNSALILWNLKWGSLQILEMLFWWSQKITIIADYPSNPYQEHKKRLASCQWDTNAVSIKNFATVKSDERISKSLNIWRRK